MPDREQERRVTMAFLEASKCHAVYIPRASKTPTSDWKPKARSRQGDRDPQSEQAKKKLRDEP